MKYTIGADLGGTTSKAAVVSECGVILARFSKPTGTGKCPQERLTGLIAAIKDALKWSGLHLGVPDCGARVGIAVNSPLEDGNIVRFNNNLPELEGFPLRDYLESQLARSCVLEWDINAALLGEMWTGAAYGVRRVVMVSVGTGIGVAVSIDGRLLRWVFNQTPGEFGHMVVEPGGYECTCGGRGCWETRVSRLGVIRAAQEVAESLHRPDLLRLSTPKDLSQLADEGDAAALAVWNTVGRWLGVGIASLVSIFMPTLVVVGGGISLAGEKLLGPCRSETDRHVGSRLRGTFRIEAAALDRDSAVVGAAWVARQEAEAAGPIPIEVNESRMPRV